MNKEIESILLQFKTAIDFAKGPSRIKYNFEISDGEKLYEYIINTQKENQRLNNVLNELKWKPIEEYDRKKYDWVLVKYHLEDNYECIPCVAEMRYDGFWYDRDDNIIDYDVDYFFDMQLLDELKELKESDK